MQNDENKVFPLYFIQIFALMTVVSNFAIVCNVCFDSYYETFFPEPVRSIWSF